MKILYIGGTGNLSLDASREALARGHELYHLNRGSRPEAGPEGVATLRADIRDEAAVDEALGNRKFDAVVDFISYTPGDVERGLRLFGGRTGQYVFISSASAYLKPPLRHLLTEESPLGNPYWAYARGKIACEEALSRARDEKGLPITVVRPSHTYGRGWIPTTFGSADFTVAARMLAGEEVVVPGDGQALWTITHAKDFARGLVGLLGNPGAIGETIQVMGDEALTWDEIHREIGAALGVEPKIVHVPSEFIARIEPEVGEKLLGDKAWTSLFDCSKLKRLVPGFRTELPFREGIGDSVAWLLADPGRQKKEPSVGLSIERILSAWARVRSRD